MCTIDKVMAQKYIHNLHDLGRSSNYPVLKARQASRRPFKRHFKPHHSELQVTKKIFWRVFVWGINSNSQVLARLKIFFGAAQATPQAFSHHGDEIWKTGASRQDPGLNAYTGYRHLRATGKHSGSSSFFRCAAKGCAVVRRHIIWLHHAADSPPLVLRRPVPLSR
ncbi:hypothetical protein K438DRAFT_1925046 [Mycena galopus ATCC 62051]|nr:hypothetical protein K438DRAFT_1925046 [Mycena galopus ATCC 62051]